MIVEGTEEGGAVGMGGGLKDKMLRSETGLENNPGEEEEEYIVMKKNMWSAVGV